MKTLITILSIALLVPIANIRGETLEPKSEVKGEVLEFGIIESVGAEKAVASPESAFGKAVSAPGARFIERTNQIPANLGTTFAFKFKITGVTEKDTADYKLVVIHPPFKNAKGEIERQYSAVKSWPTQDFTLTTITGYRLNHSDELIPGIWTFEIWYHSQKVVLQSFNVVRQGVNPTP